MSAVSSDELLELLEIQDPNARAVLARHDRRIRTLEIYAKVATWFAGIGVTLLAAILTATVLK